MVILMNLPRFCMMSSKTIFCSFPDYDAAGPKDCAKPFHENIEVILLQDDFET